MVATAANPFPNWQPGAGINFSLGKMFNGKDFYKIASNSRYQDILKSGLESGAETPVTAPPATSTNIYGTGSALPNSSDAVNYYLDIAKGLAPLQRQQAIDSAQLQQQINQQVLADAYPWVNQAAEAAAARNLRTSQTYRAFAEGLPSNVQNIMASKQAQMTSAAGAEADRARAMAAQTQAAKDFAGRYSGQYINVG
jgi:hypothetical protein